MNFSKGFQNISPKFSAAIFYFPLLKKNKTTNQNDLKGRHCYTQTGGMWPEHYMGGTAYIHSQFVISCYITFHAEINFTSDLSTFPLWFLGFPFACRRLSYSEITGEMSYAFKKGKKKWSLFFLTPEVTKVFSLVWSPVDKTVWVLSFPALSELWILQRPVWTCSLKPLLSHSQPPNPVLTSPHCSLILTYSPVTTEAEKVREHSRGGLKH